MSNSKQYKSNSNNLLRIRHVSAAFTLSQEDSGTHFMLGAAGAAITLGLATVFEPGTWFRFTVAATITPSSWVITAAGTTLLHGRIQGGLENDVASGSSTGTGENTITFVTAKAEEGDFCELTTDGVNWYVSGQCEESANVLFTAV